MPGSIGNECGTRCRPKLLEAGVPEAQVCAHLAGAPSLACARLSAGDSEQEPLHAVCPPRALPPRRCHLHHGRRAAVLHQLPGQTVHPALVPRGWVWGPVPWAWALLCGPKVPAGLLSTPLAPFSSSCRSLSGTPAQSSGLKCHSSLFLSIPTLLRRLCGGRKNLGLGIKLNLTQIPSSAVLMGWAILDT